MLTMILTPLELASLSPESKAKLEAWGIECFVQGADQGARYDGFGGLTSLERADAITQAETMIHDGHLGIPASQWFGRRQPSRGEFGGIIDG